jgi:hypothetical protein
MLLFDKIHKFRELLTIVAAVPGRNAYKSTFL